MKPYVEKNEFSGEKNYKENIKKECISTLLLWGLLLLPFLLSILSIVKTSMLSIPVGQVLGVSFSIFLKSLGLLVSVLLLWHEIDKNNRFLQHVCSGSKKINCDAVLSSKGSKIFS